MKICIINEQANTINKNSLESGCGGSETWALQLGSTFVERGHFVILCTNTDESLPGVLYEKDLNIVPIQHIQNLLKQFTFDFIIVSRAISDAIYYFLKIYSDSYKCLFYQFHDLFPLEEKYNKTMALPNKIITLTPYHAKFLHAMTDIDHHRFVIIPNGIDMKLFNNLEMPEKRDNRILWCSNPDRGLYIILKYLYDDIKKEIPDFGIDIAYPNYSKIDDGKENLFADKDIKILGSLGKNELYQEMIKHKCWCYPQNFIDTFCICMLEHTMCDVDIVCPWWFAPENIFGKFNTGFKKIIPLTSEFTQSFYPEYLGGVSDEDFAEYIKYLKTEIISSLMNYDSEEHKYKRHLMKQHVLQNYTWHNVANQYESLYINEKFQNNQYE